MTFFENKQFITKSLMELVSEEGKRIVALNLATRDDLNNLIEPTIQKTLQKVANNTESIDVLLGILSELHLKLAAIKLPGDFEKIATEEKFYKALDIPYTGEDFYELPKKKEEPVEEKSEEEEEEIEEASEVLQEFIENENKEIESITSAVSNFLEKVAYSLGRGGNHEAAYMVEKTIYSIQSLNKRG